MKENLKFGSLGNGVTVWDINRQEHGEPAIVAHINRDRKITYYDKNLPNPMRKAIRDFAKNKNVRMSVSQPEFVMLKPIGVPLKKQERVKELYTKILHEDIRIRITDFSDDIYAFASELACLKLAKHFAGKDLRIKHSNKEMWMFVIFENLNI